MNKFIDKTSVMTFYIAGFLIITTAVFLLDQVFSVGIKTQVAIVFPIIALWIYAIMRKNLMGEG